MSSVLLENITKDFGSRSALDGVSIEMTRGVTGILGPNGAGKTTLLRTIATSLRPSSGRLKLLELDPNQPRELTRIRQRLGYSPSNVATFERATIVEVLNQIAIVKGFDRSTRSSAIDRAIESLDLGSHAHRRVSTASVGVVRRALVAQALMGRPKLIVLDEPFSDLDPQQRHHLRRLLQQTGQWATVIVSGHELNDIASSSDRLIILTHGRQIFDGSPLALQELAPSGASNAVEAGFLAVVSATTVSSGGPLRLEP